MPADQADGFADNWTYLKAELQWLDRVLMTAVARQRKDAKEIDRLAQTKADRATSHWWKGVISLEGNVAYDEHRQPASGAAKVNYQQQLEAQIQAAQQRGVTLALPILCERLNLTPFEKNLVLMSLAPEINRRYARLYRFLQSDEGQAKTDLPTLDLVLRLLCRNDQEWRSARHRLVAASPLLHHHLLQFTKSTEDTLLNRPLKLAEPLVTFLIAEQPNAEELEPLLHQSRLSRLSQTNTAVDWAMLVLPAPLLERLQYIAQIMQGQIQAADRWHLALTPRGAIALLTGAPGTGKTLAAMAIAHALHQPLFMVDLAQVTPEDDQPLLQEIALAAPAVLLIKSAQVWLGRLSRLTPAQVQQFLAQRRAVPAVTLFSLHHKQAIRQRQSIDYALDFPAPRPAARLQLWQRAFPAQVPLAADIDWHRLAQFAISGGDIAAIAHETIRYAAAIGAPQISMEHVLQVLAQRSKTAQRSGQGRSSHKRPF